MFHCVCARPHLLLITEHLFGSNCINDVLLKFVANLYFHLPASSLTHSPKDVIINTNDKMLC